MKSTIMLDFMFFKDLLILVTYLLEDDINLLILSVLIGMMICLWDELLVVISMQGLVLPILLIVLLISSIFFNERLEKLSLILRMSLTLTDKAWA